MKEDVLKKAVEFNKQREKLLGTLRKTLHITDPHFRPTLVREESTEGVLTIVGSGGSFVSARFESSLKITRTDGKGTSVVLDVIDTQAGRKWVESIISELNDLDLKIKEL